MEGDDHMSDKLEQKPTSKHLEKLQTTLFCIAVLIIPGIFLFNLYNRNYEEAHIVFMHVLIAFGILALVSVLLFVIIRVAVGSFEAALIIVFLFWMFFWLFETMYAIAVRFSATLTSGVFMWLLGMVLICLMVLFRRYKPPFQKIRAAFNMLSLTLAVIFVFNIFPGVNHGFILEQARRTEPFYLKNNFSVDPDLPRPDIYWIHMDGMLSLKTVERFWELSLVQLREDLARRGFVINDDVRLNARNTNNAFITLFSPALYDNFFGRLLLEREYYVLPEEISVPIVDYLAQIGLTFREIHQNTEFLGALVAAGYDFNIHSTALSAPGINNIENIHPFFASDLPELLSMTTPISQANFDRLAQFSSHTVRTEGLVESTYDGYRSPSFTYFPIMYTHIAWSTWDLFPRLFGDERGEITRYRHYELYLYAFRYSAESMMLTIDSILEGNPDAVIVLQADHGLHACEPIWYVYRKGYSREQIHELRYSVFSAVRIPDRYGGLDAPLDPRNISRELVNRFVGQNYTLLH